MEDNLKSIVYKALEMRLGYLPDINKSEWKDVKDSALNHVYSNRFCFFEGVSIDYFVDTFVSIFMLNKKDRN